LADLNHTYEKIRVLLQQKQYPSALKELDTLLEQDSQDSQALFLLGMCHKLRLNFELAIIFFLKATKAVPPVDSIWQHLSECYYHLGRYSETEECLKKALQTNKNNPYLFERLAFLYQQLGQAHLSAEYYFKLTHFETFKVEAYFQLAIQLQIGLKMDKAVEYYNLHLQLNPKNADAHYALGTAYSYLQHFDKAIRCFERALQFQNQHPQATMELALAKADVCDWSNRELEQSNFIHSLKEVLRSGQIDLTKTVMQVNFLDINPELCLQVTKACAAQLLQSVQHVELSSPSKPKSHTKVRLGYISPDFRSHAVGRLIYDVFRHHNREQFEVYVYALVNIKQEDTIQEAIKNGSDHYINCEGMTDLEIANQIRDDEIDVLIDMGGYTTYTKPRVMALKPAPVQIHYLGNPMSMGAPFTPYMLADKHWIPEVNEKYFTEEMLFLDHAWVASPISEHIPLLTRTALGLPEEVFIFGSFNHPKKLDPETFNEWMKILKEASSSVLWLYAPQKIQQENLKKQADLAHVDPSRLYFAEHTNYEQYLGRLKLMDVFLDNFQYGAGSTAANALMMGTPVLTLSGEKMVSRLATAVNAAANMSSWNCVTKQQYHDQALYWYQNSEKLKQEKTLLESNIKASPLCQVGAFVKNVEAKMLELLVSPSGETQRGV
jgi:protein O-GlcNAc transferase